MRLPLLGVIKQGTDPLLSWLPVWLHAVVWAFLVNALVYVVLYALIRHVLPWLSTALSEPARRLAELGGALLLLPEYASTRLLRRSGRTVPSVVFGYGDAVQGMVGGGQKLAESVLTAAGRLKGTSRSAIVALLLVLAVAWDGSYCVGQGAGCVIPTSEWAHSVSRAVDKPSPAPTPCPKPKKKKQGSKKPKGCVTPGG